MHAGKEKLKSLPLPSKHGTTTQSCGKIDRASKWRELRVKEALHIYLTPKTQRFKTNVIRVLSDCWVATQGFVCKTAPIIMSDLFLCLFEKLGKKQICIPTNQISRIHTNP